MVVACVIVVIVAFVGVGLFGGRRLLSQIV